MDVQMKITAMEAMHDEHQMKDAVHAMEGVHQFELHKTGDLVKIDYDQEVVTLKSIIQIIEAHGYKVDR